MLELRFATPDAWTQTVLGDFDAFLVDHAACERKASATALHLVAHYRDRPELVDAMIELAREELEHFQRVYRVLAERGLALGADAKDRYVRAMNEHTRDGTQLYFLDRLLIAGIVEARGCERFGLVATALEDGELKAFYEDITRSEARHQGLFTRLARLYFPQDEVQSRTAELLDIEARVCSQLPLRPALH